MSTTPSIPDTQAGFTQSELVILRQATEVQNQHRGTNSTMADRGRGTSRTSLPSSRAASAASSQSVPGRISLDSNSLGRLEVALTSMMRQIAARLQQVEDEAAETQENLERSARRASENTEALKRKADRLIRDMDDLDAKMEEVVRVCEKIRKFKDMCEKAGGRLNNIGPRSPPPRGPIPIRT